MPIKIIQPNAPPPAAEPAKPAPIAPPPPAAAPVLHVTNHLANQIKTSNDGAHLKILGSGHLMDFTYVNRSASTRYLMLFDAEQKPNDGEYPKRVWTVTTLQTFDGVWPAGRPFNTGLVLVVSSTMTTLTSVTANEAYLEATFRM